MGKFFLFSASRLLLKDWPRTLLVTLGVALAAAVTVAVMVASEAAIRSFREGTERGLPRTPFVIKRQAGLIDTAAYSELLVQLSNSFELTFSLAAQGRILKISAPKKPDLPSILRDRVTVIGIYTTVPFSENEGANEEYSELRGKYGGAELPALISPQDFEALNYGGSTAAKPIYAVSDGSGSSGELYIELAEQLLAPGSESQRKISLLPSNLASNNLVVVPLWYVQRFSGSSGLVGSIGLTPKSTVPVALPRLQQALSEYGLIVQSRKQMGAEGTKLLAAFRGNLFLLVALTVALALFSVYSTALLSTEIRRREFSLLKTLGCSSRFICILVLAESFLLGGIGAVIGLTAGAPLIRAISRSVLSTVGELYLPNEGFSELSLLSYPALYLYALLGCLTVVILGSTLPALQISRVLPGLVEREERVVKGRPPMFLLVLSLTILIAVYLFLGKKITSLYLAYFALLLMCCAGALLAPVLLWFFSYLAGLITQSKLLENGPYRSLSNPKSALAGQFKSLTIRQSLWLAAGRVQRNYKLYSLPVAAALIGVMLIVGISGMISSFRSALDSWVNQRVQADIYLSPSGQQQDSQVAGISFEAQGELLRPRNGVAILPFALLSGTLRGEVVAFAGSDLQLAISRSLYKVREGLTQAELLDRVRQSRGSQKANRDDHKPVLISESAKRKLGLAVGEPLDIFGESFEVVAVIVEYSTELPFLLFDLPLLQGSFPKLKLSSVGYLTDNSAVRELLVAELTELGERFDLELTSNQQLKGEIFQIFDQTFEVTRIIRWVIVFVCAIGFLVIELQLSYRRSADLKLLSIIGCSSGTSTLMTSWEMFIMALPPLIGGTLLGLWLSWALSIVINPLSFGWEFPFEPNMSDLLLPGLTLVGVAAIASLLTAKFHTKRERY